MSRSEASYISIARIIKTQGLKGEVRVEQLLADDSVFESRTRVILAAKEMVREAEIESFRHQHGRCIAKFRGIDSISEAEKYIGSEVRIAIDALPALNEGWFYTFQLKGSRVFTTEGEYIGTVTDVLDTGGSEILKVELDSKETLIPFAHAYLRRIDPDQRRIDVELPEDLKDLNK